MRRIATLAAIGIVALLPVLSSHGPRIFAQSASGGPVSDEFNSNNFTAPFHLSCGHTAFQPCPDAQGPSTWSLNGERAGYLRILPQFGSLIGTDADSSNNARNLVLQPVNASADYTITTRLIFPGGSGTSPTPLGQTAGIIVYQGDDDFIYMARKLDAATHQAVIEFLQETNGRDVVQDFPEGGIPPQPIYLRIVKTGNQYVGQYRYDNTNYQTIFPPVRPTATATATSTPTLTPAATATAVPTATCNLAVNLCLPATDTPTPTATTTATPTTTATATATATTTATPTATPIPTYFTANYAAPQVGVFAWGGLNANVVASSAQVPADFDYFHQGEPEVPGATPTATSIPAATATNTVVPASTATNTAVPTSTSTATPVPTNTLVPTATATATATPKPVKKKARVITAFKYVSVWYHEIAAGRRQHLQIQGKSHATYGIWVHVIFSSGKHLDFFANTDKTGFWQTDFTVPTGTASQFSHQAIVTFQLWHGKSEARSFDTFTAT